MIHALLAHPVKVTLLLVAGSWGVFLAESTAANQSTLIAVATITAIASVSTAGITAYFSRAIRQVAATTTATHNIVNHVRTIELDNAELVLRVAVMDHPNDEQLKLHWQEAQAAARKQREANAPADTKVD